MSPEKVQSILTVAMAAVFFFTFVFYAMSANRKKKEVPVVKIEPLDSVDKPVVIEAVVAEVVVVEKVVVPIEPYSNIFRNIDMEQMPAGTDKQQITWIRQQKQKIADAAKMESGEGKSAPRVITFKIADQHLKDWMVYVGRHALLASRQVDEEMIGSATS